MAKRPTRELYMQKGLRLAPKTAALLLGLTLTACATGSFPPAETGTPATAESAAPGTEGATEPAESATVQPEESGTGEALELIDPTGPTPPILAAAPAIEPVIDHDPKALIGLDRSGLSKLLGEPRLVRRETPAEIWQYVGTECVFDVFLYEEKGAYRVIHAEARGDEVPQKTEPRTCLNQLLRERLDEPVS